MTNEAFDKMTKAEKRVQIAKDVIERLDAKQIMATQGTYVEMDDALKDKLVAAPRETQLSEIFADFDPCKACALGSMLICAVTKANELTIEDMGACCRTATPGSSSARTRSTTWSGSSTRISWRRSRTPSSSAMAGRTTRSTT